MQELTLIQNTFYIYSVLKYLSVLSAFDSNQIALLSTILIVESWIQDWKPPVFIGPSSCWYLYNTTAGENNSDGHALFAL